MTCAAFSQKTGLPRSTLFRLENGEQSITLGRLHQIMDRLKCSLEDIFWKVEGLIRLRTGDACHHSLKKVIALNAVKKSRCSCSSS